MITRNRILFLLGILIVLVPFSGFPTSYKTFFTIAAGLIVLALAFLYARDKRLQQIRAEGSTGQKITADSFTQSRPVFTGSATGEKFTDIKEIREQSKTAQKS